MSEALETGAETPAPAENLTPEAPEAAQPAELAAEGAEAASGAAEGAETPPEEPKKPKSPVAQLQGRVGHLTKTLHEKDSALTQAQQEIETYKALLAAQGKLPEGEAAPAARPAVTTPAPGTPEFQQLVLTEAQKVASQQAFTRDCNAIYDTGLQKHGDAFKEAVANLGALDLMTPTLVQAAMATGSAPEVINALGSDVDEAARIAALPPAAMGVELARLASKLQAPKEQRQISRAPAPIEPVGGSTVQNLDVYDPGLSDEEYYRRRAAQGARFVRAPK